MAMDPANADALKGSKPKSSDEDKLSLMRARMKLGFEALDESRRDELDDLKFAAGSPDNN